VKCRKRGSEPKKLGECGEDSLWDVSLGGGTPSPSDIRGTQGPNWEKSHTVARGSHKLWGSVLPEFLERRNWDGGKNAGGLDTQKPVRGDQKGVSR